MDRVTCRYIKRDGSICEGICTRTTGCSRHWKLYEKNMKKRRCLVSDCVKFTDSTTGCCPKHSARFHSLNYQMRQKYGAETLQPEVAYELSIEAHQPAETYESSDEEDLSDGLGLFD